MRLDIDITDKPKQEMSADAMALAADIARKLGRSKCSHEEKFDALVLLISALGVPPNLPVDWQKWNP